MFSRRRITNDQEKDQEEQNEYEDDKQGVTDDNVASVGLRVYTVRVCSQVSSLGIPSRIIHRSSHTPTHTHTHTHTRTHAHTHTRTHSTTLRRIDIVQQTTHPHRLHDDHLSQQP
eukprot:GHVU01013252.1.p1 GENE.GHVU01013252.1~~GHVU01013252.1.p1  ORF type:complete len:115 (-),score=16.05 GHVU01013252.1:60-404(-)